MAIGGPSRQIAAARAHWRTITLTIVAVLGAVVAVALVGGLSDSTRARDRAIRLQSHSSEVMILARSLAGTMARSEAALGRFVISTDRRQGQIYQDLWNQAGQQITRLSRETREDTGQNARVADLRDAYARRGTELATIALSTRYGQNAQALARYYAARDAASLRDLDRAVDGFIAAERDLLARRSEVTDATIARSNRTVRLFGIIAVLIVAGGIALVWLTLRAQTERAVAAAEAMNERARVVALEVAVAEATAGLEAAAQEREAAQAQLRQMQKLDAIGQLTGGIAHDFNNMLAVVLGGIELAKRRHAQGSDEVVRHLDSAAEGATRATALTRRLLAFARAEPMSPGGVAVADVIAGMSDLIDRTLGDGIRVETHADDRGWHIWVDRYGLENAILNLAVNARDAMDGRGLLTIATGATTLAAAQVGACAAGDYATIAVADSGCGMGADVLDRVYEPFFTTKPVGQGTGLGLSQIFGFVRQSGGEIAIRSAPGAGTTVTLYLPRDRRAAGQPAAAAPAPAASPAAPAGLTVLVVEDDARVLSATLDALGDLGHAPIACPDPLAVDAVIAGAPRIDLILSDVLMPGRTGPELVADIAPRLPHAAVLFVTGFAGEAAEHDRFGGHVVLRKPYTIAALGAAIDRAVAQHAAAA